MSPKKENNTIRSAIFLSPHIHAELQKLADSKGTTISGMVRQIVLEYLMKKE